MGEKYTFSWGMEKAPLGWLFELKRMKGAWRSEWGGGGGEGEDSSEN